MTRDESVHVCVSDLRATDVSAENLSLAELRRAATFVHEVDRVRFQRRRATIRAIARAHALGEVAWRCAVCGSEEHGAPLVAHASISTGSYEDALVVALGPEDMRIGIDVAPRTAPSDMSSVAALLFSPQEQANPDMMRVWVRKEALGKALGIGIAVGEASHEIARLDTLATHFAFEDHSVVGFPELIASLAFERRSALLRNP